MNKRIYKYVAPNYLDKVFGSRDQVTLKCSYPKDFNDPYELFLTINFNESPEMLAFFVEAVGKLPQLPTTCFSRSPVVIPMWAHYAQNLQGFAIEFDEERLMKSFPESNCDDVDYQDSPDEDLTEMLYRAYEIQKFRYVYLLNQGVFSAAYYTKTTCWSYEQERRMIVRESEIRRVANLILMDVPKQCVTALICGPRASPETVSAIGEKADQFDSNFYQLQTGRTSANPYFINTEGTPFIFNGTEIEGSAHFCGSCKEPQAIDLEECSWCQMNGSHERDAAERNPFRMLAHLGMLDSYIEGMNAVDRGARKK